MTAPRIMDLSGKRVFVAGHGGMVGSAVVRRLAATGAEVLIAARSELDLLRQAETEAWLGDNRPDVVVVAAARVGGIKANDDRPADFIADNLGIELNLIRGCHEIGVRKLLFLGSTCIYPKHARQPMSEDQLLQGPLEPTNEWYAVAKIAGIKLCQAYRRQHGRDFISLMPTNLFGPGDNYHPDESHVMAALIRRFHEAKVTGAPQVVVWGTGKPRREFLHVDDLADACVFALERYAAEEILNVGVGRDMSIAELATQIAAVAEYPGEIVYDPGRPDGTPRKLVDVSRMSALGWTARIPFEAGLRQTYADFLSGQGRNI